MRASQLQRDAEALPIVVVDDLGIAFDREGYGVLEWRHAVAPVALHHDGLEPAWIVFVLDIVVRIILICLRKRGRRFGLGTRYIGRRVEDLRLFLHQRGDHFGGRGRNVLVFIIVAGLGRDQLEPGDTVDPGLDLDAPDCFELELCGRLLEGLTLSFDLRRRGRQPRRGMPLSLRIVARVVVASLGHAGLRQRRP